MSRKYRDFPYTFYPHTCIASSIINILHQSGTFVTLMNLHWHVIITQSPLFTFLVLYPFGVVHSMGLAKCIMTGIHYYDIIQSIFTALKFLCALPIHLSFSQPLATTVLFIVSIVLPFPEGHIVGVIQYVAFLDWLFSLSKIHLNFLQVFSWLDSSFLFSTE